jgi:hypothetical protein
MLRHDIVGQWPHLFGDPGDWVSPPVLSLTKALSVVFLVGLLFCAQWEGPIDRAWAAAMAAVAIALIILTALAIWMTFGEVRMGFVPGMVGRYLFVPVLACGILWAECFHRGSPRVRSALYWSAIAANALGLAAIVIPVAGRTW